MSPPPPGPPPGGAGLPPPSPPLPPSGGGDRRRLAVVVAGVVAAVVAIVVLAVTVGGGDDDSASATTAATVETVDTVDTVDTIDTIVADTDTGTDPGDTDAVDTTVPAERMIVSGDAQLPFGIAIEGQLAFEDDVSRYTFEGVAGEEVRVLVRASDPKELDPAVYLLGPDGAVIIENHDIDGANRHSEVLVQLGADGRHAVEVTADNGAGSFEVTVEVDDHVGDADTPVEVYVPDEQTLWDLIPEAVDDTCVPVAPGDDALASFVCLDVPDHESIAVSYDLYPDADTLQRHYGALFSDVVADTGDSTQCPSEFDYVRGAEPSGRIKCHVDAVDGARLVFTSTCSENVLVYVRPNDTTGDWLTLFALWSDDVLGPLCP